MIQNITQYIQIYLSIGILYLATLIMFTPKEHKQEKLIAKLVYWPIYLGLNLVIGVASLFSKSKNVID